MNAPYFSLFANFFLTLVISRPNFRGLAQHTLDALQHARAAGRLDAAGALIDAVIAELTTAIAAFDATLHDRAEPTAGDTEAFRQARTALLDWVQEQQVKILNPALFGQPAYQAFRRFTRGKLAALAQEPLMTQAEKLALLYDEHRTLLEPRYAMEHPTAPGQPVVTMVQRANQLTQALRAADATRNATGTGIAASITAAKTDWVALATALRRAKGLLEFCLPADEEVYRFFDFSKARPTKSVRKADQQPADSPA